ncbi:hypothetical protein FCH28_37625 [Streptomyces piniterrae]|uniref:Uncharacterized protein n=1 Tax=Streptomyces piniterrae TaxID=2571125 RepID=A0A4U0MKU3_9ACTN|nr:hypothetical protein [Streptomyces piniterrae]TJZ41209.1 hypothetical protein FCH28_37625 [Streptomyces piniterrae]
MAGQPLTTAQLDRLDAATALHLSLTGGCPACDLEPDEMCVACGLCNCDRHDTCVRPTDTTTETT